MKDFPFGLAVLLAILLHTLMGLALRHNFLIASPLFPAANEPLTVRIVDVPKGGPTLATPPPSRNLSDANRKAGPLVATEKPPALRPPPEVGRPGAASSVASAARPVAPLASTPPSSASLPAVHGTTPDVNPSQAEIRTGDPNSQKKLQTSLQNLDRYIAPGSTGAGTGKSAAGDRNSGGDELQGDAGSGVFFDTRGFDLGPWANRVVAIVKSNWIVPPAADLGVKGVVSVAFDVERNGTVENVHVISTSRIPSFDQAAVNALTVSSPLPPLPADFPRQSLGGIFRFYYNLPVPNDSK
jgi:TonB family protein